MIELKVGDRVAPNDYAKRMNIWPLWLKRNPDRQGEVVRVLNTGLVKVRWDGTKQTVGERVAIEFLRVVRVTENNSLCRRFS